MKIEMFTGSSDEWDALVRRQAESAHCHLFGWKRVIENVFAHECLYLSARNADGHLVGILPLVRVRSRFFGDYLVSMPFLNYGGPLGSADAVARLTQWASEMGREGSTTLLELRSRHQLNVSLEASHRKIAVLLDLPPGDPNEHDNFRVEVYE